MADVKISALPAATTPLAGTEVLPIVQGGATDQVSVANLTAGRVVAAAGLTVDANTSGNAVRITQTGAGNALVVEDSANPDSTPFIIDTAGRVNVGGTSWYSSTGITPITQLNGTGQGASLALNAWQAGTAVQAKLIFNRGDSATQGDFSVVDSGDVLGSINFAGADGAAFIEAAQISAVVDGTPGTNDMPGRLVFSTTADGASSPTERMRINSAGEIAVGGGITTGVTATFAKNITGAASAGGGILASGVIQSDVTTSANYFRSSATTVAASFTLGAITHYNTGQGTFGAGSTVTNQYGFLAGSTLIGATNNYGFYSNIASGAGRWNFFANGTAANAFAGSSRFGAVTAPVNTVDITGSFGRGAPVTKTGDFTLGATENWIICNGTGSITVTLPAASSWTGREVMIKTIAAQTVVSASSNVVPLAGGAAGTAILAAAAGNWATLVSDGTNWIIMQG